jgi:Right handed beta helix region
MVQLLVGLLSLLVWTMPSWAVTRYVSTIGNDNNSCATSQSPGATAKRTIDAGIACMSGGDTLIIQAGTYAETLGLTRAIPNGSAGAHTTIRAEGPVTLQPNNINIDVVLLIRPSQHHITLDGLVFDAGSPAGTRLSVFPIATDAATTPSTLSSHIRIVNGKVTNGRASGLLVVGTRWEVSGNEIFNNGTSAGQDHGVYWQVDHSTFTDNVVHDNNAWGLQNWSSAGFSPTDNTFLRNAFYNNGDGGMTVISGNNHLVASNLIYNNFNANSGGLVILSTGRYYNNTVYGNTGAGIVACCDAVLNSNHLIRNNLVFNNGSGNLVGLTGASQSNNLTCNPGFVNADAGDFHLTAGSCAIDQGATLPEASPDYDGVARSAPYEVGAFEFGGGGVTLSISPTSVAAGGTVTATWAGIPSPTALDWLGLYTPGSSDTAYLAWRYTTGTASGNVPFTIPGTITPGTYELRLLSNNGFTRLAISNSFTAQ